MPYGAFNGVVAVAIPYLLRRQGVSVERIAAIVALVQAPAIWYVLWAPVVDIKFRRRTWVVMLSLASAIAAATALSLTTKGLIRSATALFVVASALNQPVSSAVGGLVAAVMSPAQRGRAAGWSQAGVLGGGVLSAGVAVWLADLASARTVGVVVGMLIALPSLVAILVDEPIGDRSNRGAHIRRMVRELAVVVRRRDIWLGIAFFVSPACAGALMNVFAGIAVDYHSSPTVVVAVVVLGGVLTAGGALAGGFVLDRIDRWRAYPIAALLTSGVTAAMIFAPLRPATYIIGAAAYALVTGFGYAAFMALALDLVGSDMLAGGTLFTLLTAALNIPVVYMLRLDGLGYGRFGIRGMLGADALGNVLAAIVLVMLLARWQPPVSAAGRAVSRSQPRPESV
jgi:hypothetical protein